MPAQPGNESRRTLLVSYVIWPAVGHMVEALALADQYKRAAPDTEVHLLVDADTTFELARACPWLAAVHTVEVAPEGPQPGVEPFAHLDRDWDHVVVHDRGQADVYAEYAARAWTYFRATAPGEPPYDPRSSLRFELPEESRAAAEQLVSGGTQIALKPAGAKTPDHYPSIDAWSRILEGLAGRFPDLTVHLIGKLRREGHSDTTSVSRADLDLLLERYPFCRDRFDIGLFNQLAVMERCGILISPHTGFAFCALAVGTPWLTISDGVWPEFFHTGVPFYSLMPRRVGDMSDARVVALVPELLDAAAALIEHRWSFWQCYHRHQQRKARLYGTWFDRLWAFGQRVAHPFSRFADRPSLRALLR